MKTEAFATMFAAAGYPQQGDGSVSDELVDALLITGTENDIVEQLAERAQIDDVFATHVPGPDPDEELDILLRALAKASAKV